MKPERTELPALLALLAGALAIGSSGIFVRVSETGPIATAFWRGALALPPLALWAGVFFAGDIGLWHLSLMRNSVGASTLEANTAPIVVSILAWAVFGERPRLGFLVETLTAFAGMLLIVSPQV